MPAKLWHYTLGNRLRSYVAALQIEPLNYGLFSTSRPIIWLSSDVNWEPMGYGAYVRQDGGAAIPTKRQLSGVAHGLYRIAIDENERQLDWITLTRMQEIDEDAVQAAEWQSREVSGNQSNWRFEFAPIGHAQWVSLERWDWITSAWLPESIAGHDFESGVREMLGAIRECIANRRTTATLILIYATIDSLAWIDVPATKDTTERSFCDWLDTYMLPRAFSLRCDAIDLYGARCAILHTRGAISNKSRQNLAKQIMYAWGSRRSEDLQLLLDRHPTQKAVAVHVGEFASALEQAFERYLASLSGDLLRSQSVRSKAAQVFPAADKSLELSEATQQLEKR